MSLENLKNEMPEYAKDIKLNLSTLAAEETLSQQQLWGCFVSCALATRQPQLIDNIRAEAADKLSGEAMQAAHAAATIMGMNNIYYRSVHLMTNKDYHAMPAKLRMTVIGNPGVDKIDFELWAFAVSAVNGCGMCLDAHEAQLAKANISRDQVQAALRIAATVNAAAVALDSKSAQASVISQAA